MVSSPLNLATLCSDVIAFLMSPSDVFNNAVIIWKIKALISLYKLFDSLKDSDSVIIYIPRGMMQQLLLLMHIHQVCACNLIMGFKSEKNEMKLTLRYLDRKQLITCLLAK